MKFDIIIAGVGGQGVLSLSAIIASSALKEGLYVKQAEVHGMSQRGGAVVADLRLSDAPIYSSTIPKGRADLILSMEPLESLRYLDFLSPDGRILSADDPVKNIPDYPVLDEVIAEINKLPGATVVEAKKLAREAGSLRATNVVMAGAATTLLPLKQETLSSYIEETFAKKGERVVETNRKAFAAGLAFMAEHKS